MSDEQDDNATVVLDITAIKEQLKKASEETDTDVDDISFGVHEEAAKTPEDADQTDSEALSLDDSLEEDEAEELNNSIEIVLFDYQSTFFSKFMPKLPQDNNYHLVSELKELNSFLMKKEPIIILFNYNANPKAVNQLTAQIKGKFPAAKSVILAKGLTPDKAAIHQKTKSGADAYLDFPFTMDVFTETIQEIWNS